MTNIQHVSVACKHRENRTHAPITGVSSFVTTRIRHPHSSRIISLVRCYLYRSIAHILSLSDRIKAFGPTPNKPFVLGLPTGSSPEGVYKNLVRRHKNGDISFRDVVTFNMVSRPILHRRPIGRRLMIVLRRTSMSASLASTQSPTTVSCTDTSSHMLTSCHQISTS